MAKDIKFKGKASFLAQSACKYTVIHLPNSLLKHLPSDRKGPVRIVATLNGHEHKCALIPAGEGTYYILLSRMLQKKIGTSAGSEVAVSFILDDANAVDVPEELRAALEADAKAKKRWSELTPGKQRGYCWRIASAKRTETRRKRVQEVIDDLFPFRIGE